MPRKRRVEYAGALYPVMSRGDRREDILLDDVDRHDFIKTLAESCPQGGWEVPAYGLMRNHYQQGKGAPGGEMNYLSHGNLMGGFALVAYPENWGQSGIMTFIVNQDGNVYQQNLGEKTPRVAGKMKAYNPASEWSPVQDEGEVGAREIMFAQTARIMQQECRNPHWKNHESCGSVDERRSSDIKTNERLEPTAFVIFGAGENL